MTSHPDKLFRDGLGEHQKVAPSTAWDRIESGLDRKRTLSPWLKIAAGLLILIATSLMLLPSTRDNRQLAMSNSKRSFDPAISADMQRESKKQDEMNNQLPFRGRGQNGSRQEEISNQLPFRGRGQNGKKQELDYKQQPRGSNNGQLAVGSRPPVVDDLTVNHDYFTSDQDKQVIASQENSDPIISATTTVAQDEITKEKSAPVVAAQTERANLTYSAEEVNARFLKKELPADATPEKKITSGLQKVVAVALDLRYEESLVGELREKKNEWLSINTSPKKRELNK